MALGNIASSVGKGLAAGAIGTVAMTVSSTLEMKMRGREGSTAPSDAAGKVLGVQPRDPDGQKRFSTAVHWGYGTSWGAVRGLLGAAGMSGPTAALAHFGAVWGNALVMLPALDVAPPATEWGSKELGVDAFHHFVYALATSAAYEYLDRTES